MKLAATGLVLTLAVLTSPALAKVGGPSKGPKPVVGGATTGPAAGASVGGPAKGSTTVGSTTTQKSSTTGSTTGLRKPAH